MFSNISNNMENPSDKVLYHWCLNEGEYADINGWWQQRDDHVQEQGGIDGVTDLDAVVHLNGAGHEKGDVEDA